MRRSSAYKPVWRRLAVALCWLVPAASPSSGIMAQQPDRGDDQHEDAYNRILQVTEALKGISDWDREYEYVERSINNVWEQNDWSDEADQFARALILEVAEIPPWEFARRMGVFNRRVKERYGLTDRDALEFQSMLWREVGACLVKNSDIIIKQVGEVIAARAADKPFTSEQVAKWTEETDPLFADAQERIARVARRMEEMLEPEQRAVLGRDLKSLHKRMDYFLEKREAWAQGKWEPGDWGMRDNAVHASAAEEEPRAQASLVIIAEPTEGEDDAIVDDETKRARRWLPHDPSTWYLYVLEADAWFGFDPAQREAAKSIHDELLRRAADHLKIHGARLTAVPPDERETHEDYETIRKQFAELQQRIGLLVTSAQRDKAAP
jgi:hypothetical protein